MSADRYTPTLGRTGHPADGTGGQGQERGLATGPSTPRTGTGCAGLALAPAPAGNCAASGTGGGLVWGVCARSRRCPAAWQRSCDRGHGTHPASRRSTVLYRHVLITTSPGRRTGPLRAAAGLVVLPERCANEHEQELT